MYRADTYSRVDGRTREEVRASRLGRSSSEEYGRLVRGYRARPLTGRDTRDSARSQSQTHWAYFRSVTEHISISICPSQQIKDKRIIISDKHKLQSRENFK